MNTNEVALALLRNLSSLFTGWLGLVTWRPPAQQQRVWAQKNLQKDSVPEIRERAAVHHLKRNVDYFNIYRSQQQRETGQNVND